MAMTDIGAKVIFDENVPPYIFVGETEVFAISKRRMVSNVRISLITVGPKTFRKHNNLNCDRIFRAKR